MVHGLGGAAEKTWSGMEASSVFWPRDLIPYELPPRSGRIMTFGYDANAMRQNRGNTKATKLDRQSLLDPLIYAAAHDTKTSAHCMDRPPKVYDREIDGTRCPLLGDDVDKHYQVRFHCWGQQAINNRGNAVFTTTDTCKDASYISHDDVFQHSCKANLGQFIDHQSSTTADSRKYSEVMGFPRYHRLGRVLGGFISPAVALSYPTAVSAAALSWRFDHYSTGIFPPVSYSLQVYTNLTRTIESAPPDATTNSNVALMLPWSPRRQILQYLAICSVVSVLVYLQGTGEFLKYSFLVCSGLLGLICVSAGTETMLRLLPSVILLTLLASWVFQITTSTVRGLQRHEVQDESVASPGCALKTPADKNPMLLVT